MKFEIINTGSELLLGRTLNTHQQWLCRRLADAGYTVGRLVCVPDTSEAIEQAVREALGRAEVVLTTGGLGPTSDDRTRDRIAALLSRELRRDETVVQWIRRFYEVRGRQMPTQVEIQAMVPAGARVLRNEAGTAPGLEIDLDPNPFHPEGGRARLILLPGPPRELQPMFAQQVLPGLLHDYPPPRPRHILTLRTTGVPESVIEQQIEPVLARELAQGLGLGYCARPGEVDVRLAGDGPEAEALLHRCARIIHETLGECIYAEGDEELEAVVVRLARARHRTIAVAESCTGGLVGHRLTRVPGASEVFLGGWIAYSNEAKQRDLGVRPGTLATHGAVSEAVAREMAEGARRVSGACFGLSLTGIAGPAGGSPDKPVGTLHIACAGPDRNEAQHRLNPWDRETFKQVSSQQALDLLRRELLQRQKPARG